MDAGIFLWLGLALFAVLLARAGRTIVTARDISGVVVTGDVHGGVHQTQAPSPAMEPKAKEPVWKELLNATNLALTIVATALTIIGAVAK